MRHQLPFLLLAFVFAASLPGQRLIMAELKPATVEAFDRYVRRTEAALEERVNGKRNFLWVDDSPERRNEAPQGKVLLEDRSPCAEVPGGLIADWVGAVFVPAVTLPQVLALVQDYNNHQNIYPPEVAESRILSRNENDFRISLRLRKRKVITVVLNTEHAVRYFPIDQSRCYSRSHSTRIAEVDGAGKPGEHELPVGRDHGFMWRLNSYWRFQERDGGVFIECEAVSLSRDVPYGAGWLVKPIVRELPKESLENTLRLTREALRK